MTTANIIAGFQTTGIFPLDRDVIVLPGESREKGLLVPQPVYTPFKFYRAEDGLYSSEDLREPSVKFASRIDSLFDIADVKTPQKKPPRERVKPSSDFVLTGAECRQKLKEREENKGKKSTKGGTKQKSYP